MNRFFNPLKYINIIFFSKMAITGKHLLTDLQHRQLGILSSMNFFRQTSGHLGLVERFALYNKLKLHEGCVNTLNFNMSGDLLASGSDDSFIRIWDWSKAKEKIKYKSGHKNDVLQVRQKFLNCDTRGESCPFHFVINSPVDVLCFGFPL